MIPDPAARKDPVRRDRGAVDVGMRSPYLRLTVFAHVLFARSGLRISHQRPCGRAARTNVKTVAMPTFENPTQTYRDRADA